MANSARPPRRTPAELRERMPRRTPEETRELMLRAAVDLIRERALAAGDDVLSDVLAHVRLTQVASRATQIVRAETGDQKAKAITTGAIYQQWPTQADFQVDLLFHIADLQSAVVPNVPDSAAFFRKGAAAGVSVDEVVIGIMEAVHPTIAKTPCTGWS